jgi:hypothetical protein
MATLKEYFDTDFQTTLNTGGGLAFSNEETKIEIQVRVHLDFNSNTKYISCYIPHDEKSFQIIEGVVNSVNTILAIDKNLEIESGLPGEVLFNNKDLRFSGRIFIYSESNIDFNLFNKLKEEVKLNGLFIQHRGPSFAIERSIIEKPFAFISHDSRDKELIAKPIADRLSSQACFVWYDEYSLKVGDNLRESIEKGIKDSKKCILILTKNYLKNPGWGKKEFDSIFTREMIMNEHVVLPIWYDVTKEEVFEYSPSLAGTFALIWPSSENKSQEKYMEEVNQLIGKIATVLKT